MKKIIFIVTTIIVSTGINLTAMEQTGKTDESLLAGQPPEIIQQIMAGLSDQEPVHLAKASKRFRIGEKRKAAN